MTKASVTIAACATLLWAGAALAADAESQCQAARAKAAGAYASCQQSAVAKFDSSGITLRDIDKFQTAASKCRVTYTKLAQR